MKKEQALQFSREGRREHRRLMWKSFISKKGTVAGAAITLLLIFAALLAPLFAGDPEAMDVAQRLGAPSAAHWFGTDTFGRDLFSRTVFGLRISMMVGLYSAIITAVLGTLLGVLAGYYHALDNLIMRLCDGLMSIPAILMAIALMAVLGPSVRNVILSCCIVYTPTIARVARSATLSVREQTYIEAIRALGAPSGRILIRHIVPNIISPVIVQASYVFATAIIVEAALSFLGAGVPAPDPSLGNILYDAKTVVFQAWWMVAFPGVTMVLCILGLNICGDGIRDVLDPLSN